MQMVVVKYFDMTFTTNVWDRKEIKAGFGLSNLEMIGWIVEEREDCIILAKEYQPEEEQFRHLTAIPKVCIQEIIKLRKVKISERSS